MIASFSKGNVVDNRYQIVEKIADGGMGSVYEVIDLSNNFQRYALKILKIDVLGDNVSAKRFETERKICLELAHPNIVKVVDFGSLEDGREYLVMELVEGGNLRDLLSTTISMSLEESLTLLQKMCGALDHAHRKGIVHRDLKPANILLTKSKSIKITDFGLAQYTILTNGLTQSGETIGTPFYMAPEQFRGEKASPLVDIYALGIIGFEIYCGEKPFDCENYLTLAAMHLNSPLPGLSKKGKGVAAWYQEFLEICTEKNPKYRFKNFGEAACFLECEMDKLEIPIEHRLNQSSSTKRRTFSSILIDKLRL